MNKALLWASMLAFAASAFAACPGGVPSGVTNCYYADSVNGLDSNAGTSTAPWQHVPGMAICTSNCSSHTVSPGDGFILMGNRTWTNSSLGLLLATNGSSGSPIYYGNPSGSTFFTPITGTANTSGTAVTWVSGVHGPGGGCNANCNLFGDFTASLVGQTITVNGGSCTVASVTDGQDLTCTASQGTHTGVAFSINVWGRPVFNAGGTAMGSNAGVANVMIRPYDNYLIIDGIECTGGFWTATSSILTYVEYATGTPGKGTNDEVKNMLLHGWTHGTNANPTNTTETELVFGDTGFPNNNVNSSFHDNIVTGADTDFSSGTSGAAMFGGPPNIYRNWFERVSDCGIMNGINTIHDNVCQYIGPSFEQLPSPAHTNGFELNVQTNAPTIYNNVIAHLGSGTLGVWMGINSGLTAYEFNDVIYDTDTGNILDPAQPLINNGCAHSGSSYCNAAGSYTYFNNTVECGPDSSPVALCQGSNAALTAVTHQNNYYITTGGVTQAPPTATLTTNLNPSKATATAAGYTSAQSFAFSPTSGSSPTVGTGTSDSTFCTAVNAIDTTAGAACLKDTTYGVAIDRTSWTVTGYGRTATTRPGTPDIGAYQYSGSSPTGSQVGAGTNMTIGVKVQ